MTIVDVLIIGAGPAGAMTAYSLSQAGLKVQILEKGTFPRRKTCGGGLTHRAYQEIPFNIDPVIHQTVTWGVVSVNCQNFETVHSDSPIAYLIDRPSFDTFLLQKAIGQGAVCHFGQRCLSIKQHDDTITVFTDDTTYQCRYLVGADGVHSRVASQSGMLLNRSISLAHEAKMIPQTDSTDALTESITFDFGILSSGYAWIFPKQDHLNVGTFRSWPGKTTSKAMLAKFIRNHPSLSKASLKEIRAYPIPLGIRHENIHDGRVILVGDAANLADPWLGEGLYYALASGKMAAEEILNHLNGKTPDMSGYSRKIHQRFSMQFSSAKRLSLLINTMPIFSVWLLKSSTSLQKMIIALLRGEKTHEETWREIKTWLPKKLLNKVSWFR